MIFFLVYLMSVVNKNIHLLDLKEDLVRMRARVSTWLFSLEIPREKSFFAVSLRFN